MNKFHPRAREAKTAWQNTYKVDEEEFKIVIVDYLLGDIDLSER